MSDCYEPPDKVRKMFESLDDIKPEETWRGELKARVLDRGRELRPVARPRFTVARRIAALAAAFLFSSSGVVYAASGAMPDSPLYPLKRSLEKAALLATSGRAEAGLERAFTARRRAEARFLLKHEDTAIKRGSASDRSREKTILKKAQEAGGPGLKNEVEKLRKELRSAPAAGKGRNHKDGPAGPSRELNKGQQRSRKPPKPGV